MKKLKFERIVSFGLPYDKRHKDPNKNYGISSMRIHFILKYKNRATQVLLSTPCYLHSTTKEYLKKGIDLYGIDREDTEFDGYEGFSCWSVGFHTSKNPGYFDKGQTLKCNILDSGKCYFDDSALRGNEEKVVENFFKHGEEWIWKYLEKIFKENFGDEFK